MAASRKYTHGPQFEKKRFQFEFSSGDGSDQQYRDNWDRIFGKKVGEKAANDADAAIMKPWRREQQELPFDDRMCPVCDGGPGNLNSCTCPCL